MRTRFKKFNRTHKKGLILGSVIGLVIIFVLITNSLINRNIIKNKNNVIDIEDTSRINSQMIVGVNGLSEEFIYEDMIIKIDVPSGAFPRGTRLRIAPITGNKARQGIKNQLVENTQVTEDSELVSFDISFIDTINGEEKEIQPKEGKTVKVSFNYMDNDIFSEADNDDTKELKVYHLEEVLDEEGNKTEEIEVKEVIVNEKESSEGELVVDADKFSVYTVAGIMRGVAETFTVTFNANGGTLTSSGSIDVESGSLVTKPSNPTPPNNKVFDYWSIDQSGNTEYTFSTPITADLNLYAQYADACTVTFANGHCYFTNNTDDGTCTFDMPAPITVKCGGTISRQDINEPYLCEATSTYSQSQNYSWYFSRWSRTAAPGSTNTSNNYNFSTAVTSNITLYAIGGYRTKGNGNNFSYIVTFDANDGILTNSGTMIYGGYGLVKQPSDPIRTGYALNCWTTSQNGSCNNAYNFNSTTNTVTSNITLYAQWSTLTYTIRFNANGGNGSMSDINAGYGGDYTLPDTEFSRDGYILLSWNTQSDGNGTGYAPGESVSNLTTTNGDIVTLYAQWELSNRVTFDGNGGTVAVSYIDVASGHTLQAPADPTYFGYRFLGWYVTGSNTAFDFSTPITQNVTLHAHWEEIETVTVTFNSNGGSAVASQYINYGEKAIRPTDPEKNNQIFMYWTVVSGSDNEYDFDTPVTGDLTLYAKRGNICTVTFTNGYCYNGNNSNGNNRATCTFDMIDPVNIACGTPVTRPEDPSSPVTVRIGGRDRPVYFARWAESNNPGYNGAYYDFSTIINSNKTLYAIGNTTSYTVTFNANGGVLESDSLVEVDSDVIGHYGRIRQPADPIRTGYTFTFWSTEQNNFTAYNFNSAVRSDITLYAHWEPITYKIRYNANSGGGSMADTDMVYDTASNLRENTFTKANATFSGWNTSANGAGTGYSDEESVINLTITSGDVVNLYAQWNCNTGYHDENGACVSNTGTAQCSTGSVPENAIPTIVNVQITRNNGLWSAPSPCTWTCNSGYTQDGNICKQNCTFNGQSIDHGASILAFLNLNEMCPAGCVSEIRTCDDGILSGSYTNGNCGVYGVSCSENYSFITCPSNGICINSCTPYTVNGNICTTGTVMYQLNGCESGYHSEDGESCITNSSIAQCSTGSVPANATPIIENVPITWSGTWNNGNRTLPVACEWICNEHYHTGANNNSCEIDTFQITWKDGNLETLRTDTVNYGVVPTYDGPTPTKTATAEFAYTFNNSWSPMPVAATENATYIAQFNQTTNKYIATIGVSPNGYGTVSSGSVEMDYGSIINISGNTITIGGIEVIATPIAATAQYTYIFSGWNNTCGNTLVGNCLITAQFKTIINTYTVTWKNSDGSTLETDTDVEYGSTPHYDLSIPASGGDAQYSYTFSGWSPNISAVTGNTTYIAEYKQTTNTYTVIWKNSDGSTLETDIDVEYGSTPHYDGSTPTSGGDAQYSYTFSGWSPNISVVTGNTTYIAEYIQTTNTYTVTWKNSDGSTLETDTGVEYGSTPHYDGVTPTSGGNAQYSYTFSGWSPNISMVTGNTIYTAIYSSETNKYLITFENWDGEIIETGMIKYGSMPIAPNNPIRMPDDNYMYEFTGWNPEIQNVTQAQVYTAVYISYAIPHMRFVSPTPTNESEITGNRFTTKLELTNIDLLNEIFYNFNGEYVSLNPKYGYNFDNVSELGEVANTTVKSIVGNNDGVVHGATRVNSGRYGGAYSFDGIDDYIELSVPNGLIGSSVEFRVKPEGGEWVHIVYVKQRVSWCYVNGIYESEIPSEYDSIFNRDREIGRNEDGIYFTGIIDEVIVYDEALQLSDAQFLYKSHLKKYDENTYEFETINTCLDATGTYEFTGGVTTYGNISISTGRNLTTNIPGISVDGTGYDFGTYVTTGENRIITGTMGTLSITDYIGKMGWKVYFTTSPALVGENTQEEIDTNNLKFKANNLIYNPLFDGIENTLVGFGSGISTEIYNTAKGVESTDNILEYIIRETNANDFMCSQVGVYSDNTEIKLEVPAWQIQDNYEGILWITLQIDD